MSSIIIIYIVSFLISVVISAYAIPKILYISVKKNLLDLPDERKHHSGTCSRLGGVAFFPAIFLSAVVPLSMFSLYNPLLLAYITPTFIITLSSAMLMYFTGVADDIIGVSYRKKFSFQIFASIIVILSGNYIDNLYGIFGITALPVWIGFSITLFIIVFIINAVNLIDGIDGLASGLSALAFIVFGILFTIKEDTSNAILSFVSLGALLPFFFYNVFGIAGRRYKIFMGDGGALMMGLLLATLAIALFKSNDNPGDSNVSLYVIAAFSPLIIPCFDVIRVVLRRYKNKKPLFLPDNNHIHHKFLALGLSHRRVMLIIIMISALFTIFNIVGSRYLNLNLILLIDAIVWISMHIALSRKIRHIEDL